MLAEAQVRCAKMSVSKRFGRFKDEEEKAVRTPQVAEDQALKQLTEAWGKVRWKDEMGWDGKNYPACLKAIAGIQYTAKDVEKFSIALADLGITEDSRCAGLFLSALVNNCPESEFVIHAKHLDERVDLLGYRNTKNITIVGDAGNWVGSKMTSGKITVEGNTGFCAGDCMKNGEIVISGNSRHDRGY
jgi:hypothetical protein